MLPWANVTMEQATAACAAINDSNGSPLRLCTAWEWQQTCNLNATPATDWSMSASTTVYENQVCNDAVEEQRCSATYPCKVAANCNSNSECTCATAADCSTGYGCTGGLCVLSTSTQRCTPGATPSQCGGSGTCNASGQCTCVTTADCSAGFTCNGALCTGTGAWPTGTQGAAGSANICAVDFGSTAGGKAYDLSGNLQEWTSTPVTVDSGTAASIGTPSGGQVTINGLTSILSSYLGAQIVLSGATAAGNNGTFDIVAINSTTSVTIANPAAVAQATASVKWSIVYNKLRGGNYATTSPLGESCEFDFDIEKSAFVNNDVGFRCCADHAP